MIRLILILQLLIVTTSCKPHKIIACKSVTVTKNNQVDTAYTSHIYFELYKRGIVINDELQRTELAYTSTDSLYMPLVYDPNHIHRYKISITNDSIVLKNKHKILVYQILKPTHK